MVKWVPEGCGFESQTFPLDFGPFPPYLHTKKDSGGYLCLKLEPEAIKSQIWKIFCFPLSPTVLDNTETNSFNFFMSCLLSLMVGL